MSKASRRAILIVVVVIVAIGVIAAAVVMLGGVTVPDVTGRTQADATRLLEDAGLEVGEVSQASDAQAAAGTVLLQDPPAGTEVDEGSAVALTLSSGPGTAEVPDVVGMDRASAEAALSAAGFTAASALQYDVTAPVGEVVDQLPAAGDQAAPGSRVGLLVSKGRPERSVRVPDVTGMAEAEAIEALADAGLAAVTVDAYVADVPEGDVAEQEPAGGDRVAPLSEVLLTVSLGEGSTTVEVPDVVGKTQAAATGELEAAGLVVTAAEAWSSDVAAGRVVAQAPEAGRLVEEGGDAGILVSLGPLPVPSPSPSPSASGGPSPTASPGPAPPPGGADPPEQPPQLMVTVPDVAGMDVAQAEEALTSIGLKPVPLDVPSATTPAGVVYAQLPEAGEEVPKTYPVLLLVSSGVQIQTLPAGE